MAQASKVIDVTRSFVPVNPNSFPQTMHGTEGEDRPETRFPVLPYKGYNFLPTAYGVKSYFGTSAQVMIDSLLPNKADRVFVFQTLAFKNIIVALCDTGIWTKDTTESGAWTHHVSMGAPAENAYSEWWVTTIRDNVYVYRSNQNAYYKFKTDIGTDAGFVVETLVPDFINMPAQLGMSRLGGRICFWDAENAIAWSAVDNFTSFTPSILTGSNVTKFNSISGRISNIVPHGKHAIAYSTKGITFLEVQPADTFLIRATPILAVGVTYAKQVVANVEDTTHFCYGDTGIYKIENGKPEQILVQLFDYFKEYTNTPIYLKLLEGRYLCFETTDDNTVLADPEFTKGVIPPGTVLFPTVPDSLEDLHDTEFDPVPICDITNLYNKGDYYEEHKAAADAAVPPANRKKGTHVQAIYTCYISKNGAKDPSQIEWGRTPCGALTGGHDYKMSPNNIGDLSKWTHDSTNKTPSFGPDAYLDGNWTMERFIALQTAIWKAEEQAAEKVIKAILARNFGHTTVTTHVNNCVIGSSSSDCFIGTFPKKFSEPQFGYNFCSFWLTRYCIEAADIKTLTTTSSECNPDSSLVATCSGYVIYFEGAPNSTAIERGVFSSASEASNFAKTYPNHSNTVWTPVPNPVGCAGFMYNGEMALYQTMGSNEFPGNPGSEKWTIAAIWVNSFGDGYTLQQNGPNQVPTALNTVLAVPESGWKSRTDSFQIANYEEPNEELWAETAYCELTHWKYVDVNGNVQYVPATVCSMPSDKWPKSTANERIVPQDAEQFVPVGDEGSVCGIPFTPSPQFPDVIWPDGKGLQYPGNDFLFQLGSLAPKYPTFAGAFVYDLGLQKWGKIRLAYKQLLDYSPLNSTSGSTVDIASFGIIASVLKPDGLFYQFDDSPEDSRITYGKIGFYRAGITDLQEVRFDFKSISNGNINVNISLDGSTIASDATYTAPFMGKTVTVYPPYNGKWYSIEVEGKFDITYFETKGLVKGRR